MMLNSLTKYVLSFGLIYLSILVPSAMAIQLKLDVDSYRARILQNGDALDFYKGKSLDIARGTIIEIPDEFLSYDEHGHFNLEMTLLNWQMLGTAKNKTEFSRLYQDNVAVYEFDYVYPVKIINLGKNSGKMPLDRQMYMALGYIAKYGKFQVVGEGAKISAEEAKRKISPSELISPPRNGQSGRAASRAREINIPEPKVSDQLRCEIAKLPVKQIGFINLDFDMNSCSKVKPKLEAVSIDHFRKMRASERPAKFAEYMAPIAQYVQALTGFPSSVLIAQAGIETGWGTSPLFRRHNGLFGKSCWRKGSRLNTSFQLGAVEASFSGSCAVDRPANEGGHYYTYQTREDSVMAYIYNVLVDDHHYYDGVRNTLARARSQDKEAVADWRLVANGLEKYSAIGKQYIAQVKTSISRFHLDDYDVKNNTCQQCMQYSQLEIGDEITTSLVAETRQQGASVSGSGQTRQGAR